MLVSRLLWPIGLASLLFLCVGCGDDHEPQATRPAGPPGALTPPALKAWVILHTQDGGIGFGDNWGSRLTEQEMTAYMNNVVRNASKVFGSQASFTWSPAQIQTIAIDIGPKPQDRRVSEQASVGLLNALTLSFNDPNAINIYFTGWIQHPTDTPLEETLAFSIDPSEVDQGFYAFLAPFVLVNDGDWNTSVHQPAQTDQLYLEHEVAHYLLRGNYLNLLYSQQTDQTEKGLYDYHEHFIAWPSSYDTDGERQQYEHLMKDGRYRPLFPRLDDLSRQNANNRFYDDRWKQP